MIAEGLIDEVRHLMAQDYAPASVVRQTIGYREIARCLAGEIDLATAIDAAKRESRRLAKRQMTWFRRRARSGLARSGPRAAGGVAALRRIFWPAAAASGRKLAWTPGAPRCARCAEIS